MSAYKVRQQRKQELLRRLSVVEERGPSSFEAASRAVFVAKCAEAFGSPRWLSLLSAAMDAIEGCEESERECLMKRLRGESGFRRRRRPERCRRGLG